KPVPRPADLSIFHTPSGPVIVNNTIKVNDTLTKLLANEINPAKLMKGTDPVTLQTGVPLCVEDDCGTTCMSGNVAVRPEVVKCTTLCDDKGKTVTVQQDVFANKKLLVNEIYPVRLDPVLIPNPIAGGQPSQLQPKDTCGNKFYTCNADCEAVTCFGG